MPLGELSAALEHDPFPSRALWSRLRNRIAVVPTRPLYRIAHMGAALAASNLARGGIQFATSLVIARALGRSAFGAWTVASAGASALTVAFDLGFGVLLTREAARNDGRVGRLLADALVARFVLFLPVGVLAYSGVLTSWIGEISPAMLHAAVVLAAASLAYGVIASVCRAAPRPLMSILSIETAGAVLQCAGAAALIARGAGVPALLQLATVVLAVQSAGAVAVWRQTAPTDRLAAPSMRSAWEALRRALPFALTGLVANAQARLGPLLLGVLSGAGEAASFGVATRLVSVARRLPSSAFGAALPVMSQEVRRGSAAPVQEKFARALRWFAAAAAAVFAAGASTIVRLTYGSQFASAATPLLFAGLGLAPTLVNSGRRVYLYAAGRENVVLRWSAAALAIQGLACALLIPRFGAAGAMAGLAIGEAAIWFPLRRVQSRARGSGGAPSAVRDAHGLERCVDGCRRAGDDRSAIS
jgi:O-antigen/teichoic acid export membrane protein